MNAADDPRFRNLHPLGRGGTAEVLRAHVIDRGHDAALKFPLPETAGQPVDFATLADREYHLIGKLTFPGLVRLLELPHHAPDYLLLELCAGPTLEKLGRVADTGRTLDIISAIAVNLEYLHAHGIIHGDLKPQNVFLPSDWQSHGRGEFFFVKLSDFSLGRIADEPDEQRVGLGTVGFMAPETIATSSTSHRSDLFALGVIAYQLLTGRHPFLEEDADPVRVNARIAEESPIPLEQHRPDIDAAIIALVNRLLAKDESARPLNGLAVCEELARLGCRYPYHKALHPRWFLEKGSSFEQNLNRWLRGDAETLEWIRGITDEEPANLRLLLTTNYRLGKLSYAEGHFSFTAKPYWPARLRKNILREFISRRFSVKRNAIKAAVVGNVPEAQELGIVRSVDDQPIKRPFIIMLPSLLRSSTVRQLSRSYARTAEQAQHFALAARLWVQAGDLVGAERCAYQAAYEMRRNSRNRDALALLRHVITYADMTDRGWEVRQLLMLKGDLHKENGEAEQSLACYQRIVELYADKPPDKLLAETYKDLGDLYKIKQDYTSGLEALNTALAIYRKLGDDLEISHTLNNLGNVYWLTSNLDQSLREYRAALKIQRRLSAVSGIASTLSNLGSVFAIKGRFRRAVRLFDQSLALKREIGHQGEIARTLNNLGYTIHVSGDPERAVGLISEALDINRRIGSKKEILFNMDNLAVIMITAGRLQESLEIVADGVKLSDELGDKAHKGIFQLNRSTALSRMGNFADAMRDLESVQQVLQEIDDTTLGSMAAVQHAEHLLRVGRRSEAYQAALEALGLACTRDNALSQVGALLLLARLSNDPIHVRTAEKLLHDLHLVREAVIWKFCRLEYTQQHEQPPSSTSEIEEFLAELHRLKSDVDLPWMYGLVSEAYLNIGEFQSATRCVRNALALSEQSALVPERMTSLTQLGRIQASLGEFEKCYASYQRALSLAKQLASNIADIEDRTAFLRKPEVNFLAKEIKRLAETIGDKKRRAGSGPALAKT